MNQVIMIFLVLWFVFLASIIGYWGTLAWFYPAKLRARLGQDAQHHPDRLWIMRAITLIGTISIIVLTIMVLVSLTT